MYVFWLLINCKRYKWGYDYQNTMNITFYEITQTNGFTHQS